jgi:hypothetical protein
VVLFFVLFQDNKDVIVAELALINVIGSMEDPPELVVDNSLVRKLVDILDHVLHWSKSWPLEFSFQAFRYLAVGDENAKRMLAHPAFLDKLLRAADLALEKDDKDSAYFSFATLFLLAFHQDAAAVLVPKLLRLRGLKKVVFGKTGWGDAKRAVEGLVFQLDLPEHNSPVGLKVRGVWMISYEWKSSQPFARELDALLKARGITTWRDETDREETWATPWQRR